MFVSKSLFKISSVLLACVFMLASAPIQAVQAADVRYAKPVASGLGDCLSWGSACTLQTALTEAESGQEIWAAAGVYKPSTDPSDRTSTFLLKNGVTVYGGFAGTENNRSLRNPAANLTVLSGDIDNNDSQTPVITDIASVSGNATNSYQVVTGATGATLDGFTITAGNANGSAGYTNYGGGMWNNSSSPTLTNLAFRGNAANYGAGMLNYGGSNPVLTNVTFSGNTAVHNGGGMFNSYSDPVLTNVTFSGNHANEWGGGLLNDGNPTMTNVTFSGNSATSGGGIYNYVSRIPHIDNTILWGDTAAGGTEIYNDGGSSPVLNDSVVQGGCPTGSTCTNIISGNPNLGTLGDYGGFTQTVPLLTGSSAIDAGNDATCAVTDQRGVFRPQGLHCDIGAYEVQTVLLAVPGGLTSGPCESWAHGCELRYALNVAVAGQEVWAAAGTYKPIAGTDQSATFQLVNGVGVYGGFAGTETARTQRNPASHPTILSGDIDNNDSQTPVITDLSTVTGNGTNSYHVVTGATGGTLDGVTVTAGAANGSGCPGTACGGGMYNLTSSPTVMNVIFSGNTGANGGGMDDESGSNPTLTNVTFSGNAASSGTGGAISNVASSPALTNVTISDNSAATCGGGIYTYDYASHPSFTNVTIAGNSAGSAGGGICTGWSYLTVINSILWGNAAPADAQFHDQGSYPSVSTSIMEGGYTSGTGILTADPHLGGLGFFGGFTETMPILAGSSAINSGDAGACPATDQRGMARVSTCDIGAFEYSGSDYVSVRYAKTAVSGSGDCSSWTNACSLQEALHGASFGYEIWAAAGTYKPTAVPADRSATFLLKNGVSLYGGFAGTETARTQRNPASHPTILSGDIDNNDSQTPVITDLTSVSGNGTNSYHVVSGSPYSIVARLDGVTITAGAANGSGCPGTACGGGMYNLTSSPTVMNVIFSGNTGASGGGMDDESGSNPVLANVTFSGNAASSGTGGAISNYASSPVLTNVTISDNSAATCGGGIYTYDYASHPSFTNVTIAGNSAGSAGGGICTGWSYLTVINSILWGNAAPADAQFHDQGSYPSVSTSIMEGGYTSGTGILTADPHLGGLGFFGGFTETMPILAGSSAINSGDAGACPATDQRGMARVSTCDIGAFEYSGSDYVSVRYAKTAASGSGDCSSWTNACSLQEALHGASFGYEIWAAAGTYKPTAGTDRSATFLLKNGVSLYGGFAGTETARTQRNPVSHPTILSGDIDNNDSQTPIITDLTSVTGNGTNSYHVVSGSPYSIVARLDGVTITAGAANGSGCPGTACGGGMYNLTSSPTVMNVIFSGNTGAYGGGMDNESASSPTLENVTFSGNAASSGAGGAMSNVASSPALTNVTFSANTASACGGAIYNYDYSSHPSFIHVTIAGNSAPSGGGMCSGWSYLTVRNSIIWGNLSSSDAQFHDQGSIPTVSNSVVQDGYASGTAILTADPHLGALGFFGGFTQTIPILAGSSAIDTGDPAYCPATDQRGVTRPQGSQCDMGAFEQDDLTAPTVVSSVRANANPTSAASVDFTVTFNEAVSGVGTGDFELHFSGVVGASVTGVSGSGSVYTVTVNTGSGNGSIRLDIPASGVSIFDLAGNPLAGLPYTSGQIYTVNKGYRIYLPLILR